jgi:hypothetical protein
MDGKLRCLKEYILDDAGYHHVYQIYQMSLQGWHGEESSERCVIEHLGWLDHKALREYKSGQVL